MEWVKLYIENLGVYHESQPLSPWNTFVLIKRCNKGFLRAINIFSHHHTWSVSQNVLLETQFDREKKINQEILLWTDRFEKRGLEGRLIEAIYIRDLCIYLAWLVRIRRYEGIIPSYYTKIKVTRTKVRRYEVNIISVELLIHENNIVCQLAWCEGKNGTFTPRGLYRWWIWGMVASPTPLGNDPSL